MTMACSGVGAAEVVDSLVRKLHDAHDAFLHMLDVFEDRHVSRLEALDAAKRVRDKLVEVTWDACARFERGEGSEWVEYLFAALEHVSYVYVRLTIAPIVCWVERAALLVTEDKYIRPAVAAAETLAGVASQSGQTA